MKTPSIQNIFKMMIGTSALIASTAFFINTISPVQASEVNNTPINSMSSNIDLIEDNVYFVDAGYMYVCNKGYISYFCKFKEGNEYIKWVGNKFSVHGTVVGGKFKLP